MTGSPLEPVRVVLALGSNLDDRRALLRRAVSMLGRTSGTTIVAVSPVYETAPVGGPEQGDYLNAVVVAETGLGPRELLGRCQAVEAALGRVRGARWGPRTVDVDVITYGELTSADEDLTLPHPRAHLRAFVLAPWADVDPGAVVPGRGPVAGLLAALDQSGVRRRDDVSLRDGA